MILRYEKLHTVALKNTPRIETNIFRPNVKWGHVKSKLADSEDS